MSWPKKGTPITLKKGRRVLRGHVAGVHRNGTRMDSGHFILIETVAKTARAEWWDWQGWEVVA